MSENTQGYKTSSLQFSSSKLYFQHQNQMLQKIWFVSPMSIDIHFKYTFQEVQPNYFIEWWEFEWLNVDHEVHEQWIIYKIWLFHPKYQNIENLFLDLKKDYLNNPSMWRILWWVLWWGVAFALLYWLSDKWQFCKVLFWLNVVWWGILLAFLLWKVFRKLYKNVFKTKKVDYGWFMVSYTKQTDALMLSSDVIGVLKKLSEEYWVIKFCYTGNCIYLLQDIHDREWNRLDSSSKLYSEQEKASLQQRTLDYIHQVEFLSQFTSD